MLLFVRKDEKCDIIRYLFFNEKGSLLFGYNTAIFLRNIHSSVVIIIVALLLFPL